jgi:hypothetical protein
MKIRYFVVEAMVGVSLTGLCPTAYRDPIRDLPTDLRYEPPALLEAAQLVSSGSVSIPVKAPYGYEEAARRAVNVYHRYGSQTSFVRSLPAAE